MKYVNGVCHVQVSNETCKLSVMFVQGFNLLCKWSVSHHIQVSNELCRWNLSHHIHVSNELCKWSITSHTGL